MNIFYPKYSSTLKTERNCHHSAHRELSLYIVKRIKIKRNFLYVYVPETAAF